MKKTFDDIENMHPFSTPDGYFEGLTSRIQERIAFPEKRRTFRPMLVLKWSVAPLVILVTFFGYLKINEPEVSNEFLADVSNQEIIDYLESTGINETELIALIDQTNLDLTADPLDHVDLGEENLEDLIDEFNLDSDYL